MAYGGLLFVAACLAWCIVVDSRGDESKLIFVISLLL